MHIEIGNIKTLDSEEWEIVPDDRQSIVQIVGGAVVQDFGHEESGDKISCTVTMTEKAWWQIKAYWNKRQRVDVKDETGAVWKGMRIVVKSYAYIPKFPRARKATLEFWRA